MGWSKQDLKMLSFPILFSLAHCFVLRVRRVSRVPRVPNAPAPTLVHLPHASCVAVCQVKDGVPRV